MSKQLFMAFFVLLTIQNQKGQAQVVISSENYEDLKSDLKKHSVYIVSPKFVYLYPVNDDGSADTVGIMYLDHQTRTYTTFIKKNEGEPQTFGLVLRVNNDRKKILFSQPNEKSCANPNFFRWKTYGEIQNVSIKDKKVDVVAVKIGRELYYMTLNDWTNLLVVYKSGHLDNTEKIGGILIGHPRGIFKKWWGG